MLDRIVAPPLRVLVVWEPVIASDVAPPTTARLSILHDVRVAQYWDPRRVVSRDIVRAVMADPSRYALPRPVDRRTVVWDIVAVFPPGVRWGPDLPPPAFHDEPVIRAIPGLERTLEELRRAG